MFEQPEREKERETDVLKERFEMLEELGRGDGGVVWMVKERKSGLVGAVKVGKVYGGEKDRLRHLEELDILRSLCPFESPSHHQHHPNIITLLSAWEQSSRLHLHTPLYSRGDLSTFLDSLADLPCSPTSLSHPPHHSGGLDEPRTWKLLASLSSALAFAHSLGIVHLDIKPSNVLVDAEGEVKLGDWGYSARLTRREVLSGKEGEGEEGLEREGDRDYLSPEGIRGVVGTAGDVFR
ncbi:kinase-like domain-containing protein [Mrakia frigida]|uniref:kinase-like domain-containing protein n=1 Tax=Mrakia frigida TaxID=29902 RepID=UPI003FCBF053